MIYLTQEEVDDLPEGAMVEVKWSGGNGPHTYIVGGKFRRPWKVFTNVVSPDERLLGRSVYKTLDFVGEEPLTTVRLLSPWFQGY